MNIFVEPVIEEFNCTKTVADTAVIVIPMASSMISGNLFLPRNFKHRAISRTFENCLFYFEDHRFPFSFALTSKLSFIYPCFISQHFVKKIFEKV